VILVGFFHFLAILVRIVKVKKFRVKTLEIAKSYPLTIWKYL